MVLTFMASAVAAEPRRAVASPLPTCGLGTHLEFVVLDANRDGYPESDAAWQCVGHSLSFYGRSYFTACPDPLGFCVTGYVFLRASEVLSAPAVTPTPHRRAVREPRIFFLDADGDGYGGGEPIIVYSGPILSRWVLHGGDCNDANPLVHDWQPSLLPDCNGNGIAESDQPQTICVGDGEPFTWTDSSGSHTAVRYRYVEGNFWIPASSARRKADGALLLETPCSSPH